MAGLPNNNDFLNEANKASPEDNSDTPKKKRRTALEIEQEKYPEYYALNEYQRKCLVSTNYWNVLYRNPIVEVPPSDAHYHKYFDKKCYDRYTEYQDLKRRTFEHDEKLKKYKEQIEIGKIGQEEIMAEVVETKKTDNDNNEKEIEPSGDVVSPTEVIEVKDAVEIEFTKAEPIVIEKVVDSPVENKESKKTKHNNEEQTSLF